MGNKYPKKEDKSNHVRPCEDTESNEAEYKPESADTEEVTGENSIITFKTIVGQQKYEKKPFQALEFTIMVNGKPVRALVDTGTIGGTFLSTRDVTTNNMPYESQKNPVNRKMAVKGSRSTSKYSASVDIQRGKMKLKKVEMIITLVSDCDILPSMHDQTTVRVVIAYQMKSIYFLSKRSEYTTMGTPPIRDPP